MEEGPWKPSSVQFILEVHLQSDFSSTSWRYIHPVAEHTDFPLILYSQHLAQGTAFTKCVWTQ